LVANRLMFGPRPGDLDHIAQIGVDAFIEEQLAYEQLDDEDVQARIAVLPELHDTLTAEPRDLVGDARREIILDLQQATLLRAVYGRRQLHEVMTDFWSNHFNIYFAKNAEAYLKPTDDREVIRPRALGNFRNLLFASAHSPAMLVYLDNVTNIKGKPNENYARELMELHTLGVDGGYTQPDVEAVARAFTGWTARGNRKKPDKLGQFIFAARLHDDEAKTVLGHTLPARSGKADGERVLDLLASHPSTAAFISRKLARRFISDDPPASVVKLGAGAFTKSKGDIRKTLGAILHSAEFKAATGQKMKRPFEFVASALRATNAETDGGRMLSQAMLLMGQPLFLWAAPNGYPDVKGAWLGADSMLARWNFALALGSDALKGTRLPPSAGQSLDALSTQLLGTTLPTDVKTKLQPFEGDLPTLMALLLSSPLFQFRG
jgi:uncharacterized protein (DUF1800 family)